MLVHLAASHSEYAERTSDNSEISANRLIDYQTRCTYNLLHAASEAGVSRCIYASSLSLFAGVSSTKSAATTIGPSTSSGGPVLPPSRRFWRSTWESSCAGSSRGKGELRLRVWAWGISTNLMITPKNRPTQHGCPTQTQYTFLNARWRLPHSPGPSIIYSRSFRERVSAAARRGTQ